MVYQDIGQHISHQYDEDLESLRSKVLNMGGLVEKQVQNALLALTRADSSLAEDVATSDYRINSMEIAIDEECTQVIARRQPAASDLRLLVTIYKTITDLERIGDEAEKNRASCREAGSHRADPDLLFRNQAPRGTGMQNAA